MSSKVLRTAVVPAPDEPGRRFLGGFVLTKESFGTWLTAQRSRIAEGEAVGGRGGPELARRINRTLQRADQIEVSEGGAERDWFVPIVADAEAGFGGVLNAFELMKAMIEAGAAGVHFEDQLASVKKCGHMGGKVLVPTRELAMQVAEAIHKYARGSGISVVPLYGGASISQQIRALQRGVDICVATPGRDRIFRVLLGALVIPGQVAMVPLSQAIELFTRPTRSKK